MSKIIVGDNIPFSFNTDWKDIEHQKRVPEASDPNMRVIVNVILRCATVKEKSAQGMPVNRFYYKKIDCVMQWEFSQNVGM